MSGEAFSLPAAAPVEALERLAQVKQELERRRLELNTLFDIGKALNERFERGPILDLLLLTMLGQLAVSRAMVYLVEGDRLRAAAARGVTAPQILDLGPDEMGDLDGIVRAAAGGTTLARWLEAQGFTAAVPMSMRGELQGIVCLGRRVGGLPLGLEHDEFLSTLGNLAAAALEHARLFAERLSARRVEEELQLARTIQAGLLPRALPDTPELEIAAISLSSHEVGGDYYDVLTLADGDVRIAVGDVAGKGVPAALLMANVQASYRALRDEPDEVDLMTRLNRVTHENTDLPRYITFVSGRVGLSEEALTYVNAGHNPPYLLRPGGQVESLCEGGLILGVFPLARYVSSRVAFRPGDLLVLYTDGVTEAMNPEGDLFGEERLLQVLEESFGLGAGEVLARVQQAVDDFAAGAPQRDDLTLLVVRRR